MYDQNTKSALMNGASAGGPVAPQSAVAGALDALSDEQQRTRHLLDRLADRIQPILSGPTPVTDKAGPGQPHASQLHGDLLIRASVQGDINATLDDLLSRVTV